MIWFVTRAALNRLVWRRYAAKETRPFRSSASAAPRTASGSGCRTSRRRADAAPISRLGCAGAVMPPPAAQTALRAQRRNPRSRAAIAGTQERVSGSGLAAKNRELSCLIAASFCDWSALRGCSPADPYSGTCLGGCARRAGA